MHQYSLELFTRSAEVFEIDDHLGDLREVAHALKLLRDLLADVI